MEQFGGKILSKTLYVDVETTGLSKVYDQVVQVAYAWEENGVLVDERCILVKPTVPISKGASETHGITEEAVANAPPFRTACQDLAERIREADIIATYNGNRYDIPILDEEFKRAGVNVDLNSKAHLDSLRVLQEMRPSTLSAMHEQYVGAPLEGAHDALADIRGTLALYNAMKQHFGLEDLSDEAIAHSLRGNEITLDGKFVWDEHEDNVANFGFGKYAGRPVEWVIQHDPGYLSWIITADKQRFDFITGELVTFAEQMLRGPVEFKKWLLANYGGKPKKIPTLLEQLELEEHDCWDHLEETVHYDGDEDGGFSYVEVVCKVCGNDLTEEYNDPSNWEPDEDWGRER